MKSLDFGRFTQTGKDIEDFAITLTSFHCCLKIISNQILSVKDAKKLLRSVASATSSKLSFSLIDDKSVDSMHHGQIKQVTGIFNGIKLTANENTTVSIIITTYNQVDGYRREITGN